MLPTGVYQVLPGKFAAQLQWGGKYRYIGTVDTTEQASAEFISIKNGLAVVNLSAFNAIQVEAAFDAAKKKARELFGGLIRRGQGRVALGYFSSLMIAGGAFAVARKKEVDAMDTSNSIELTIQVILITLTIIQH